MRRKKLQNFIWRQNKISLSIFHSYFLDNLNYSRMAHLNIEIKARCSDPKTIERYLLAQGADFRGEDHQIDTYFQSQNGRLKLREGHIEHSLIYYERPDQKGPKPSEVILIRKPPADIKVLLTKSKRSSINTAKFFLLTMSNFTSIGSPTWETLWK